MLQLRTQLAFITITVTVLFGYNHSVTSIGAPPVFGLYNMQLKDMENCEIVGEREYSVHTKLRKCQGKVLCNATVELKSDFSNQIQGVHSVYVWGQGGWKLFQKNNFTRGCSEFRLMIPEVFFHFFNNSNCPVSQGNYDLANVDLTDLTLAQFPQLIYGQYKSVLEIVSSKDTVGCFITIFNAVPAQ